MAARRAVRHAPRVYRGWYLVGAALVAQFVALGAPVYATGVFLKPMSEDLGWSRAQFTIGLTLGQFVMGAAGFFIGSYIDRHGARPLMLIGIAVLFAGTLLTSQITELWQWLLLRGAVVTVGSALLGNLVVNVTLSKWFVEHRGRAIGTAAIGLSAGGLLLPPLLTPIIDEFGWRAAWRVLAVGSVVLALPAALMMRRQPEDLGLHPDGKSEEEVRAGRAQRAQEDFANSFTRGEALRTPQLYLIIFGFGVAGAATITLIVQGIPYMTDAGFSRSTAALVLSTYALGSTSTKPGWGYLAERIHPRYLAAVAFVIAFGAMLGIVAAVHTRAESALFFAFLLLGVSVGGQLPIQETIWASYFGRRYLGEVRSVGMPLAVIAGSGAPLLAAVYFDRVGDYDGAFIALGVLWLVAAGMLLAARPPESTNILDSSRL